MGKQPEDQLQPRGFLGLEWSETIASGRKQVSVRSVLNGLPAAHSGLRSGDCIVRINDRAIEGLKDARIAVAQVRPGDPVPLVIRRGSGTNARELRLTLTAGEGL
jgi:S1-C subfamily serine protease